MRMSIGENIQTLINRWYAYGALMRAQHNNTKTDVRSLPYRVALRCKMGFFGFQQEMGRGSKWDTRGTQWYKVDVEGCGTRFMQYKGRTRLWEAYKVTGKQNVGKKLHHIMRDQYIYVKFYYTKSERPMHPCAPYHLR